jgi:endonuclease-3 related protein
LAHEAPFAIRPENAYNSRRAESQHCVAGWTNEVTHDRSTRVLLNRKRGALIPRPYRCPVLRPSPLIRLYDRLYSAFGPQQWWPAKTPFEVIVGAVLTQNAAWRNVEQALANLRNKRVLVPRALHQLPQSELAELIRPSGYFRLKAQRLKNLTAFLFDRYRGSLKRMFSTELATLRRELLTVNGIGPETADSILLYAGNLPTFVVDTYTQRVLKRHGWIEPEADYHTVKRRFEETLLAEAALFNEFHALLVRVGNQYCRKTPDCEHCPLAELLPADGPRDVKQAGRRR